MVGGAYRGPVGVGRQRRTIRFVQILLALLAAGLLVFAGYSFGEKAGYEDGSRSIDAPAEPSTSQGVVLVILGMGAIAACVGLQSGGGLRLLTPARLREMEEAGEIPIVLEEEGETQSGV